MKHQLHVVESPPDLHPEPDEAVLDVRGLGVEIETPGGTLRALTDVDFSIRRGETLCFVGESGCGKTMTSLAVMGLLPRTTQRHARHIRLEGRDLQMLSERELVQIRGERIGAIFQDPMTSLNPVYTVGNQLEEIYLYHGKGSRRAARERAEYLLERVGITAPQDRMRQFPHELSGGLRQRVMIAMALMCEPTLIIADEPTTALDVTIQAQILGLLKQLQAEFNTALMLITHDMGVVAHMAGRVAVMYAGRIVEHGATADIFAAPSHPYTEALLACIPDPGRPKHLESVPGRVPSLIGKLTGCAFRNRCRYAVHACSTGDIVPRAIARGHEARCIRPIAERRNDRRSDDHGSRIVPIPPPGPGLNTVVEASSLTRSFALRQGLFAKRRDLRAVDGIDLAVHRGETLAIVGESGSGKTTLARVILGLLTPSSGTIKLNGRPISDLTPNERARQIQPVFQDPYASLNPRKTVSQIVTGPLDVHGIGARAERRRHVADMLDLVGLSRQQAHAYPNQLSGGQRQRVAIARALIMRPDIVVCDEPTSALDVSVQAQILNLLADLKREFGVTYIFISHNLSVVRHITDRAAVMYLGRTVEQGPTEEIFADPQHPYTRALLASALPPRPGRLLLPQQQPRQSKASVPTDWSASCAYHPHCALATGVCRSRTPEPTPVGGRLVACHVVAAGQRTAVPQ